MALERMTTENQRRRNRLTLWGLGAVYFLIFASSFLRVGL